MTIAPEEAIDHLDFVPAAPLAPLIRITEETVQPRSTVLDDALRSTPAPPEPSITETETFWDRFSETETDLYCWCSPTRAAFWGSHNPVVQPIDDSEPLTVTVHLWL